MDVPNTRYVSRRDGVSIAYQVLGDGPIDLLLALGFISHLDLQWTEPAFAGFLQRLASFSRLIAFDKPGTGLSDPIPHVPTLEERVEDMRTVLDAAGSCKAALFATSEQGPTATLFAATSPERTSHLLLYGSFPKVRWEEADFEHLELRALGVESLEATLRRIEEATNRLREIVDRWGQGLALSLFTPSLAAAGRQRRWSALYERAGASPAMVKALFEVVLEVDVTDVLPSVRVPTLVLHRRDDFIPVLGSRFLASRIPGARLLELPGADHAMHVGDTEPILAEIEDFLTGRRGVTNVNRVVATVLFTDIVGSTAQAAMLGDQRWTELLRLHEAIARNSLRRFVGRELDTAGDGFLATFDGPAQAIRCARATVAELQRELSLPVRAGVHTGEAELGADGRVTGVAVHIGARVAAAATGGEVMVSSTVKDLVVGSGIRFDDRGIHRLKGVPGEWRLFAVVGEGAAHPPDPLPGPSEAMSTTDRTIVHVASRAMRIAARLRGRRPPASRRPTA
jgi:class 3 adenylate cyclase